MMKHLSFSKVINKMIEIMGEPELSSCIHSLSLNESSKEIEDALLYAAGVINYNECSVNSIILGVIINDHLKAKRDLNKS